MIEIEKKFLINQTVLEKITKEAKLISQKKLIDIYYDTKDFKLTTKDWWLRNRNGIFELKKVVLANGQKNFSIDRYDEVEDLEEICKHLKIDDQTPFEKSLENSGIKLFAEIIAERKKYKKGDFILDFDLTDFGYSICEIELMVDDETKIDQAMAKIENFRKENGLSADRVKGKLIEYIYRNSPEHYQTLREAGVVKD